MKKEIAIVEQTTDYQTKYDFSSFSLKKRLIMAMSIITQGGFYITGKEKNKNLRKD